MDIVIQILVLFLILNSLLKMSFWSVKTTCIFGAICGIFMLIIYPYVIQQSKTDLVSLLQTKEVMQNIAVLVTIDSAIYISFCFRSLSNKGLEKQKTLQKMLHYYVSPLLFPALFYLLTELVFSLTGFDFEVLLYLVAIAVAILFPLLVWGLRYLIDNKEFRLEIQFLVTLVVSVLGLICTVDGRMIYTKENTNTDIQLIAIFAAGILILFSFGFVVNRLKKYKNRK